MVWGFHVVPIRTAKSYFVYPIAYIGVDLKSGHELSTTPPRPSAPNADAQLPVGSRLCCLSNSFRSSYSSFIHQLLLICQ